MLLASSGPGSLVWKHSGSSCHLPTIQTHTLLFIQGLFLEHPQCARNCEQGSSQSRSHSPLHSTYQATPFLPQACSFSLLVSTLCTSHSLQFECLSFHYPLWVTCVSGSAQLSPLPRKPFLTDCRGLPLDPTATLASLSAFGPLCVSASTRQFRCPRSAQGPHTELV